MSLLMDALRKAEQEKKAAAERLREQHKKDSDPEATRNLSLESADKSADQSADQSGNEGADDGDATLALPDTSATPVGDEPGTSTRDWQRPAAELELTPLEMSQPLSAGQQSADAAADSSHTSLPGPELSDDETLIDATADKHRFVDINLTDRRDSRQLDDTSQDKPELAIESQSPGDAPGPDYTDTNEHLASAAPDRQQVPGQFDNTAGQGPEHSDFESTRDDTISKVRGSTRRSSADLALEGDTSGNGRIDTPATARHVFAARKSASPATLTIIVLVALIVIGLTASGVFYYYSVVPMVREVASPRVAQEIEMARSTTAPVELPQLPAGMPQSSADATDETASTVAPIAIDLTTSAAAPTQSPATSEPDNIPADGAVPESADENETISGSARNADTSGEATEFEAALAESELELKPALLKISKTQASSNVDTAVKDAYAAYRRGDYALANELYHVVLRDAPNDRNALLGLGAIAMQQQRYDAAYRYYTDILRQNPSDRVAQTALMSLQQQANPASSESRLIQMLADEPDASYLYQALGHVYARTNRWPQAQKAYFDAYSRASNNPDYAYNLAVSLDHIGQPRAALDYYRKALELAEGSNISFSRQSAQDRINQISQSSASQ